MSRQTITEFLEARIAEDEALATSALGSLGVENNWWTWSDLKIKFPDLYRADAQHMEQQSPRRILAECAAKRGLVRSFNSCAAAERSTSDFGPRLVTSGMVKAFDISLKILAAVYRDHPDYRQEWSL
jgi:hypothetical protein